MAEIILSKSDDFKTNLKKVEDFYLENYSKKDLKQYKFRLNTTKSTSNRKKPDGNKVYNILKEQYSEIFEHWKTEIFENMDSTRIYSAFLTFYSKPDYTDKKKDFFKNYNINIDKILSNKEHNSENEEHSISSY